MYENHSIVIRSLAPDTQDVQSVVVGEQVSLMYDQLGIADVRVCIERAQRTPQVAAVQTLVVRTNFITHESQNALLKILEEPPLSTRIVLVIPTDLQLLPPLLSRVQLHEIESHSSSDVFNSFLAASYAERLQSIEQAIKQKDTGWQRACKQGLVEHVQAAHPPQAGLLYVAQMLLTRGASNKMLFEHAALLLPVRK